MLELSEREGAIYGDSGTENCTEVLHHNHMYYESSPTTPPCGDCATGKENQPLLSAFPVWTREAPCKEWKRTEEDSGRENGEKLPHECISFKRRAKHAEVKLNSQTEDSRSALSPLCCHSFPAFAFFNSLSQEASPFPHTTQDKFYLALLLFSLSTAIQV